MEYGPNGETILYDYPTPDGEADIFFIYVFDAGVAGLTTGNTYGSLGINIKPGGFVCRSWNGAHTMLDQTTNSLGTIQIYGRGRDKWWDSPASVYTLNRYGVTVPVFPERSYQENDILQFELNDTEIRTF